MSAGEVIAWLDAAISKRERRAHAAPEGPWVAMPSDRGPNRPGQGAPGYEDWKILGHGRSGNTRHQVAGPGYEGGGVFGEAAAKHITLHDPVSVLRRCAADRKLMALHNVPAVVYPNSGARADDRRCVGCGFDSHEEPMVDDVNDCPTLRALAEGYGWTGGEQ